MQLGPVKAALGVRHGLRFLFHRAARGPRRGTYRLWPRRAEHPLDLRASSSDWDVFRQVFIDLEYGSLRGARDVRLVIDCGAYAGFSSAFFLSAFPECRVVAVEPDPGNFAMLERNLRPYAQRVTLIRGAVWSHGEPLHIVHGGYRDGRDWATQVRPCRPGEAADLEGVAIETILASSGFDRISVLKIDVEGSEAVLMREPRAWIAKTDAIAIELHDDSGFGKSSDLFAEAIAGQGFEISRSGDVTICRRAAPRPALGPVPPPPALSCD